MCLHLLNGHQPQWISWLAINTLDSLDNVFPLVTFDIVLTTENTSLEEGWKLNVKNGIPLSMVMETNSNWCADHQPDTAAQSADWLLLSHRVANHHLELTLEKIVLHHIVSAVFIDWLHDDISKPILSSSKKDTEHLHGFSGQGSRKHTRQSAVQANRMLLSIFWKRGQVGSGTSWISWKSIWIYRDMFKSLKVSNLTNIWLKGVQLHEVVLYNHLDAWWKWAVNVKVERHCRTA